jgi:dTDP-4-dehydrorhamnose reductase
MLKLAAEREALNVIADQFGAPTGAELLADVTAHALVCTRATPALGGTYHCVAGGETHWQGYARFVIEWARAHGVAIKVAADAVRPIPTSAYPTPAQRPLNSRLDTGKLRSNFGLTLPHWQAGVERMLTEIHGR